MLLLMLPSLLSGPQGHTAGSCPLSHPPVPPSPFQQGCTLFFLSLTVRITETQVQDLTPLLNLMRFFYAHCLSLSSSLWMASCLSGMSSTPHCLVPSSNLLRMHLISMSMSLMKILKRLSFSSDCWGMPLAIDLHLDIEPLTTALWVWSCNQSPSIEQSTHHIHIFPIWRAGCCGEPCLRSFWSPHSWHQWLCFNKKIYKWVSSLLIFHPQKQNIVNIRIRCPTPEVHNNEVLITK